MRRNVTRIMLKPDHCVGALLVLTFIAAAPVMAAPTVDAAEPATGLDAPAAAVTPTSAATPTAPPDQDASRPPRLEPHDAVASVGERLEVEQEQIAAERARAAAEQARKNAEQARREALLQAEQAHTAAARSLARRRAVIETARMALAAVQEGLAQRRVAEAGRAHDRLELENRLLARSAAPELSHAAAGELYDAILAALDLSWSAMGQAIDELGLRTEIEPLPAMPDLDGLADGDLADRSRAVRQALAAARALEAAIVEEDQRLRGVAAADAAQHVIRLNRVRSAVFARLAPERESALTGLGKAGIDEFWREFRHLTLMFRWTPYAWTRTLTGEDGLREDVPGRGTLGLAFLRLLALLVVWLLARNRLATVLPTVRNTVLAQVRSAGARRVLSPLFRVLIALGRELLLLLLVILAAGDIIGMGTLGEFAVLHALLLTWAWYRLAFVAANRYLHAAASLRSVELSAQDSERILWSLKLVGRYVFALVAIHVFTSHAVGDGFILALVVRFSWLGALPIAVMLLRRWRTAITTTYLRYFPQGDLANRVRTHQGEASGSLIALAAFAYVAVRGITLYLRDVALQFEQTRRALAYLFRRRLERHAEQLQAPSADLSTLPDSLRAAFGGQPVQDIAALGGAPGQADLVALIDDWLTGGPCHSVMVSGEHGIGRTTWLGQVVGEVDEPCAAADVLVHRACFDQRITDRAELCRFVSVSCGLSIMDDPQELMTALRDGPRRLVILDDCQRALLRSMDGLSAWRALCELTIHSAPQVFWVLSCTASAWRFARSLQRGRDIFSRIIKLNPWSEERIDALIRARMEQIGFEAVYDDLIFEEVQGGLEAEGMRVGERYMRLLWGHANGNPRDAAYFWLRSLVPDGEGKVRVRLFRAPGADELEQLGEFGRFVLAAVVQHETLTAPEAARALGEPERDCRTSLAWLTARGYLIQVGARYEVSLHWHRAVLNYLKRKHLAYE